MFWVVPVQTEFDTSIDIRFALIAGYQFYKMYIIFSMFYKHIIVGKLSRKKLSKLKYLFHLVYVINANIYAYYKLVLLDSSLNIIL